MSKSDDMPELENTKTIIKQEESFVSSNNDDLCNRFRFSDMKTVPLLTSYERARIFGERATQLEDNSIPYIITDELDPLVITALEYKAGVLAAIIRRYYGYGCYEDVLVGEPRPDGICWVYKIGEGHIKEYKNIPPKEEVLSINKRVKRE
jgi:DNA-directed RNA polymerase subunit K/omega